MYRTMLMVLISAGALLHADGLTDLRKTLGQLHAETAVKGSLEIRTWNAREGAPDRQGVAHAWVEAGPEGLKVQLGKAILQALGEEARANRQDPEAPSPVTQGVKALEPSDLAEMVNAAPTLLRQLEGGKLVSESAEMWQGKPARLLTFELPLTGVGPKDRKMIKEFKATAKVWVDGEGLPLAAHTKVFLKGRALMVISFTQEVEESFTFGRAGNRLLCLSQETEQRGSGGGEKGHSRVIRTFRVQS